MVFTKQRGEELKRIFVPKGTQAGEWWRVMVVVHEIMGRKFVVPCGEARNGKKEPVPGCSAEELKEKGPIDIPFMVESPCCLRKLKARVLVEEIKSFTEVVKKGRERVNRVGKKRPGFKMSQVKFKLNQNAEGMHRVRTQLEIS